ncbi:hypothetical protein ZOSMA_216G00010 [Zostera marina]|uniref:Uncharacterized protein n=1 Tax=Zostera marina TaxID=29655 RepID=A0A0K9PK46_ZOSMR|nr:hypothetical protein ZOSMA_216G00010 [Zostera marina]
MLINRNIDVGVGIIGESGIVDQTKIFLTIANDIYLNLSTNIDRRRCRSLEFNHLISYLLLWFYVFNFLLLLNQ